MARIALTIGACWLTSCVSQLGDGADKTTSADSVSAVCCKTNRASEAGRAPTASPANSGNDPAAADARVAAWIAALEADSLERLRHPKPSDWRLPNCEMGPGRPEQEYRNFYMMDDLFPDYLLCRYPVDESAYDPSQEPLWFKLALEQVRRLGPKKFPPIRWVAVCICNVAEHKDAATYEQSYKVGAVFKAPDVFSHRRSLRRIVGEGSVDRHPFQYLAQPTPRMPQRSLVVERHAATNHTATGSTKR